jgi:hypothetical protein
MRHRLPIGNNGGILDAFVLVAPYFPFHNDRPFAIWPSFVHPR